MSFTKTYHGWHHDGAAAHGRYHKAVIMVSKSSKHLVHHETGHSSSSNLQLVPSDAVYGNMCDPAFANYYHDPYQKATKEPSFEATIEWMQAADELSCTVDMDAGDVIIFREDTLHRTQDETLDRVAFIWDILRLPLPETPVVYAANKGDETNFISFEGRRRLAERPRSAHAQFLRHLGLGHRRSADELNCGYLGWDDALSGVAKGRERGAHR